MMDLKGAIAEIKNKDNTETFDKSVHSLQAIVDNLLAHGTYGLAAIKAALDSIAVGVFYGSYGPRNVEVGNDVDFGVTLYDPAGNVIATSEITPGTYTVRRVRSAVDTEVVSPTASSEAAGRVYMTYNFPAASWQVGDIFYIIFSGIQVTVDSSTTEYPDIYTWGRVVREADISAKIGESSDLPGSTTLFARLRQIVDTYLTDGVHGLAALKALIDAVEAKIDDGTTGLAALKSLIDAIEAKLDDGASGLDALKALIDAAEAKLDKLAGETPASGSVTANWQSGTASSGETGADVVTFGANDTKKKLHSLLLSIHNFASGGKVIVKLFMQVNGTERKVYEKQFTKGTDPDGLWVVNSTVGIHEALRVEAKSDKGADNGVALHYDYMLEAM
ncbi:hypothetical protein ACFLUF_02040 [Chloroflexota bacterium]